MGFKRFGLSSFPVFLPAKQQWSSRALAMHPGDVDLEVKVTESDPKT